LLSHNLLSAAIVSENFWLSSTSEQVFEPFQVPESVLLLTVPLDVRKTGHPLIGVEPFTSRQVWVIVTGAGSPYSRSLNFVHAVS